MKKILLILLALGIIGGGYYFHKKVTYSKEPVPAAVSISDFASDQIAEAASADLAVSPEVLAVSHDIEVPSEEIAVNNLPTALNLDLPFYSQAPFSDWSYPWQEACEEATVLLVANIYFNHNWSREEFRDEILDLVQWEMDEFGAYEHTTIAQTDKILNEYFGLRTVVHENPDFDDLKKMLAKGHLVVMTFSGKQLGNPFYTNGGPVYHAMVLKGYKEGEKLIFHDVGTRRGEDYVYSWDVIKTSMRDWAEPITIGAKRVIEVLPPDVN